MYSQDQAGLKPGPIVLHLYIYLHHQYSAPVLLSEIYSKLSEQGKTAEGFLEAPLAYDAVWAIALGREGVRVGLGETGRK